MELQKQKCSLNKHQEIDAVSYCQECKKYFCNKCQNMHSDLLEDHKIISINKLKEVFIDKCKEDNHNDILEFFCKDHNILCCAHCITKIKDEKYIIPEVFDKRCAKVIADEVASVAESLGLAKMPGNREW